MSIFGKRKPNRPSKVYYSEYILTEIKSGDTPAAARKRMQPAKLK